MKKINWDIERDSVEKIEEFAKLEVLSEIINEFGYMGYEEEPDLATMLAEYYDLRLESKCKHCGKDRSKVKGVISGKCIGGRHRFKLFAEFK